MKVVILCGGQGTRVSAILKGTPKVLAKYSGKTFLEIQLDYLSKFEVITDLLLLTGVGSDLVLNEVEQIKAKYNFDIKIKSDEDGGSGTANALFKAYNLKIISSDFILLFGDSLPQIDLNMIISTFSRNKPSLGMTYISPQRVSEVGRIELKKNRVFYWNDLSVAPDNLFVDYGVTYMTIELFELYRSSNIIDLKVLLQLITQNHVCNGIEVNEPFIEIGNRNALLKAQTIFGKIELED